MKTDHLQWWSNLRHGGLLLDLQRLSDLVPSMPAPLPEWKQDRFRREIVAFQNAPDEKRPKFVGFVLEDLCGFTVERGEWNRGSNVSTAWTRRGLTGESLRPNHLWLDERGAALPVFLDGEKRIGIGRGKRITSRALQWLRQGTEQLAIITNGNQWRIVFAGLDYEAWSEWELDQWLAEGRLSDEFDAFRALVCPALWTPPDKGQACPLLAAINNSRKGQSDLSKVLGERVRQAAELLIDGHAPALNPYHDQLDAQDIYRAAVRVIMRMVVILFAESREGLLPRDNPVFHSAYSLQGLRELLDRSGQSRLVANYSAWPRILALFRLIFQGASHEALPVPKYGGELFAPGSKGASDGMKRALHIFESACFEQDIVNDALVRQLLDMLTRTKIAIRQGRSSSWMMAPVDFSCLDSEYIGILYEGLLDFELRCGVDGQPIVFLAVGNQPALPLATLEAMDDRAVKNLFEKLKDTSTKGDEEEEGEGDAEADSDTEEAEPEDQEEEPAEETEDVPEEVAVESDDPRFTLRARAEQWAQRAVATAGLMKKPKGKLSPEKQIEYDRTISAKARQLITKVVMPGEWYLVRWGGTRKGSGTFYTRPQLAIPTVHRTLRPLAYNPPKGEDGQPNFDAPAEQWKPKRPEEILALKVCDPACGSGSFPLAALRYLTNALYESLIVHKRVQDRGGQAVLELIFDEEGKELLADEKLPCRPEDDDFEVRTKAILRRYVVERCIYGVDLDPLAVELCRLSLWIETLDRNLPLTFLNHKIKCGNSLVGAWFDRFLHYPAMAWDREGGDKNHSNGVHFRKEEWTKAIKEKMNGVKAGLKDYVDGAFLKYPVNLETVRTEHDVAAQALREIHAYGITQVQERAERYDALITDPEFVRLKEAFDLWCALWFWSPDQLDLAPMPLAFASGNLSDEVQSIVRRIAAERRFFHWELEFPDVFHATGQGFDAILGNPPWDIAKPVSKEFFSAIDPLYRSYGKQEAIGKQKDFFQTDEAVEARWLTYNAFFRAMSNWVKYAGRPFGDRVATDSNDREKHDLNLGDRGRSSFDTSAQRHARWKQKREETTGYADADHVFQHQGSGDINLYKMFLEQAHALLRIGGRLGLIVPSGLYSDHGTGALRRLFLDQCSWEWIFGFTNTQADHTKVFDIHPSYKFNPVIVEKNGKTHAIRTAFMRRNLADWEHGEDFVALYTRERVAQFSPHSLAILEIQSPRDLEVLTNIYANGVLLGDHGPESWGIAYAREFDMTNDSKLFPPRTKWEEWGYQPDEYSRWIQGPWKPIEQLYTELGLKPLSEGERRCAQPPYERLAVPRADIPEGIILSREVSHYLNEDEIPIVSFTEANGKPLKIKIENSDGDKEEIEVRGPAVALPLYQGIIMNQLIANRALFGTSTQNKWAFIDEFRHLIWPKYLIAGTVAIMSTPRSRCPKYIYRSIARTTDSRTIIGTPIPEFPAGNSVGVINLETDTPLAIWNLGGILSSYAFDWQLRRRIAGTNINMFFLDESCAPTPERTGRTLSLYTLSCAAPCWQTADKWLHACCEGIVGSQQGIMTQWAIRRAKRVERLVAIDAIALSLFGINETDAFTLLEQCDYPVHYLAKNSSELSAIGFWRIDKDKHPEHRHTVLTLVAFHELQEKIAEYGGDMEKGIEAFCTQNDGEGWMLPETLRLADYGLGHDDRAKEQQPVRECFGPRFYDWQLAQSPEESWRECHLHARNLLGKKAYEALLDELQGKGTEEPSAGRDTHRAQHTLGRQLYMDSVDDLPLFAGQKEEEKQR